MRQNERYEMIGLAALAVALTVLTASSQTTFAASQGPGSPCTVSLKGSLGSLQMTQAGTWALASSQCEVTGQSGGVTSGSFTGSLVSNAFSGTVTGTWSVAGGTQTVAASGMGATLSVSYGGVAGQVPGLGTTVQGTLSATGSQLMFVLGTSGQVALR